ncbi:MAG TPA: hypothetical protein V6D43_18790 [Candidatus Sericytochromatia bacterium]
MRAKHLYLDTWLKSYFVYKCFAPTDCGSKGAWRRDLSLSSRKPQREDGAGYLRLLEKGMSGKMWYLCPSGFARELKHLGGRLSLPQPSSRHRYFKLTGFLGQEESS